MRHEYKHSINYSQYLILKHRLKKLLPHDVYVNAQGNYLVRSLYFDDPFDTALLEKINGVACREKFRLRCYNNNFHMVKLEKKSKIKYLYKKESETLTNDKAKNIINGDLTFNDMDKPLIKEIYTKMKTKMLHPKTIVEYIREPFIFAPFNIRITIDHSIKTALSCRDFFKDDALFIKTYDSFAVLEVKFEKFIPSVILNIINLSGIRTEAISKYAVCRRFD